MRTLGLALVALLLTGCTWPLGDAPGVGVSAIVPYDGGFLVSDDRHFEGSVGLWFVRDGRARDLPGCSTGTPRRVDGWVWWVTALCPESGDLTRTAVHRARPDGSHHSARVFKPIPGVAMFVRVNRYLDRVAPLRSDGD